MNNSPVFRRFAIALAALTVIAGPVHAGDAPETKRYDQLLQLVRDWRAFERPPLVNGAEGAAVAPAAVRSLLGEGALKSLPTTNMGGEDFAF